MFGREVAEGEQRAPVLLQAFGGLLVLDPIGLGEDVERRLGVRWSIRTRDATRSGKKSTVASPKWWFA
jgi:hypothetical protein